ncbi:MAG: 3-dehydroquinate synthase [Lachnospiraceae bacterium]|nr:3-dehydroquinate synthase [Lachnospiraceae bacterium]
MNDILEIKYDGRPCYNIVLENDFSRLAYFLDKTGKKYQRICIVSDTNVAALYIDDVHEALRDCAGEITQFVFQAGEASKNLNVVEDLYENLIKAHFDRKDLLVALGGGVVGDLTGFAAATYLRGIDFIQMPTSLLSMVDSSIGGKTGVDFRAFKNMVGAFYMPRLVYMNLSVLKSLPAEQFRSGMGEVIKHGLIADRDYFDFLIRDREKICAFDPEAIFHVVKRSCEIKGAVVEEDPKEQGIRATLNFGHTIGHAVEKLSKFSLFHGQCVAVGSVAASYLSMKKGYLSEDDYKQIRKTFEDYGLPVSVDSSRYQAAEILKTTKSDKKMQAGRIKFILLEQIGKAVINTSLTDTDLLEGINEILR